MKYLTIFCGGDVKLSVMVVLRKNESHGRKNESHVRSIESHVRNIESRRVFLCRCKPTTKDFGKRFGGGIYIFEKNLQKYFGN